MAFIDELAKRFGDVVKKVGEKSEQLVELGKLNYELFKEEDAIKRLYREIGQAVYEAYKQENNSLNDIYRLCQEIDEHKGRIEELKKQMDSLKKEAQGGGFEEKSQFKGHQAAQFHEGGNAQSDGTGNAKQDVDGSSSQDADREEGIQGNGYKNIQEGI